MRKILAALALIAAFIPAIVVAQAPPPVPALPDAERRTSYAITNQTGPFDVGFSIYGDGTGSADWLEVWLNGVRLTAVTDWTLALSSGAPLGTAARPLTNAQVTLLRSSTGTLQIVGARRPRRLSQLSENRGVSARDFNQLYTDAIAELRERWDYVTRQLRTIPGESLSELPNANARKGGVLGFDAATGTIPTIYPLGSGVIPPVTGPSTSSYWYTPIPGQYAVFDTSGQTLRSGGYSAHGQVEFINDGTTAGMLLIPYNGNGFHTWCPATSSWKMFNVPPPVTVTNVTAGPGNVIRITHATSTVPFVNNQVIYITGTTGVPNLNVSGSVLSRFASVIDANTIDLVGSTFSGAYAGGGLIGGISGAVAARADSITINGVPNQSMAANVVHYAGLVFKDAACTVGEIVLSTGSYNWSPEVGFNILNQAARAGLLGSIIFTAGTVQGSVNSELGLSWYNRGRVNLVQGFSASSTTGGLINTWVKMGGGFGTGTVDFLIWPDAMPNVMLSCGIVNSVAGATISLGLSMQNSATAPDIFQTTYDPTGNVPLNMTVVLAFPAVAGGFYRVTAWGRTSAGTLTLGSASNCSIIVDTEF